jgi:hypothetical protein
MEGPERLGDVPKFQRGGHVFRVFRSFGIDKDIPTSRADPSQNWNSFSDSLLDLPKA